MANFCTYHPGKRAWCYCDKCGSYYCADCARRTRVFYGKPKDFFFCPKCNIEAEMLSVASLIDPFWKRLNKFFTYPLQLRPLAFILILPLFAVILQRVPLINLVIFAIQMKYCYDVLRSTANGGLSAPKVSCAIEFSDIAMVLKQFLLIIIPSCIIVMIFIWFGSFIGILSIVLVLLLVPSMIIVLVSSESLIAALNPVYCITLATRIGASYLLLCLFLLLLFFAPGFILKLAAGVMPKSLLAYVSYAAVLYYTVISYNLMGYVILQHHEEIGYKVDADEFIEQKEAFKGEESPAPKESESAEAIISRSETLIRAGRTDDALFVMESWMRKNGSDKTVSERFYNLLKVTKKTPELLAHAKTHLDLLTAENERDSALNVYTECLACDPEFEPGPEVLFKIGQWQIDTGDTRTGAETLVRFVKTHKGHQLVPNACFILARGLHEKMHDSARAEKLLKNVIQRYPHHDLTVHAQKYLAEMGKQKV